MDNTMKTIQLAHLENQLVDINRQIRKHEGIMSSGKVWPKQRDISKSMLEVLIKRRRTIENKITDAMFLDGDL
jgi:hypothetical protein